MVGNKYSPSARGLSPPLTPWLCSPQAKRNPSEHVAECVPRALATQAQLSGRVKLPQRRRGGGGRSPHWHVHLTSPFGELLGTKGHISVLYGDTGFCVPWKTHTSLAIPAKSPGSS